MIVIGSEVLNDDVYDIDVVVLKRMSLGLKVMEVRSTIDGVASSPSKRRVSVENRHSLVVGQCSLEAPVAAKIDMALVVAAEEEKVGGVAEGVGCHS